MSTTDQDARMQIGTLVEVGVAEDKIFIDHMSGRRPPRNVRGLTELLKYARDGDQVFAGALTGSGGRS